jgi:hypothetical protein
LCVLLCVLLCDFCAYVCVHVASLCRTQAAILARKHIDWRIYRTFRRTQTASFLVSDLQNQFKIAAGRDGIVCRLRVWGEGSGGGRAGVPGSGGGWELRGPNALCVMHVGLLHDADACGRFVCCFVLHVACPNVRLCVFCLCVCVCFLFVCVCFVCVCLCVDVC